MELELALFFAFHFHFRTMCMATPYFGRSVKPISTSAADYSHHITTPPPQILRPSYGPAVRTISMVSLSAAAGLANDPRNLDSLLMVGLFLVLW